MKRSLTLAAILGLLFLISVPLFAAGVNNVTLNPVGSSGTAGMATTIVGDITGPNPYHNVEINMRVDKTPPANMVYEGWLTNSTNNMKQSIGAFDKDRLSFRERMVHFAPGTPFDGVAVSLEPAHSTSMQPTTIVATGMLPGSPVAAADFQSMAVLPDSEMFQKNLASQKLGISSDQYASLRMQGWSYSDIALMSNAAAQCNKKTSDIAAMLSQGQSWDQISASCGTSTAELFGVAPSTAVAGSMEEVGPGIGTIPMPVYYRRYPNHRPVITEETWRELYDRGYSWQDVAYAANIAAMTGEDVYYLLRQRWIVGTTWQQMAMERGISLGRAMNISNWPFGTRPERIRRERMGPTAPLTPGNIPGSSGPEVAPSGGTAPAQPSTPSTSGGAGAYDQNMTGPQSTPPDVEPEWDSGY